ncbi:MAG: prolipoprotein diacylglyceryl transferase [Chloroflexota bacterium]
MNGIVISIDPVILRLGDFELRWYSIAIILAVIAAVAIAVREGKRRGLPAAFFYNAAPWVLVAGLVGARLFHVIDRWPDYAGHPMAIFQVQQGGLAIWGGLVGGGAALLLLARMSHIPAGKLMDVMVPAILTAQIIGRLGCIINGDAYGGITGLPWGFIYTNPDALIPRDLLGVPTHPYPVYEMLWNGATLLVLLKLREHFPREGGLFFGYLTSYSLGRLALSFVRQESMTIGYLQQAQVIGVVIFLVSAALLMYLSRRVKPGAESASSP